MNSYEYRHDFEKKMVKTNDYMLNNSMNDFGY